MNCDYCGRSMGSNLFSCPSCGYARGFAPYGASSAVGIYPAQVGAAPTPYVYIIGSLRNGRIPEIAEELREAGFEVFDDWYAAGPEADDYWQRYERYRGHTYAEALKGEAAQHVFQFDKSHLERATHVVLVLPAGKSGHLELGWALGNGKRGYILLDDTEPERFDVMYAFADAVVGTVGELLPLLKGE